MRVNDTQRPFHDAIVAGLGRSRRIQEETSSVKSKMVLLSLRVLRRILAAKESLFKFETFVPKNDREADVSPEADRWRPDRTLEWLRLGQRGTFDGTWTWDRVQLEFSDYRRKQGHRFLVLCI
jgi:hypothetical protein